MKVFFNVNKLHIIGKRPYILESIVDERLQVIGYQSDNLYWLLGQALEYAREQSGARFTMLMSPELTRFWSEINKKQGVSRSEYIRNLITREIKKK